MTPDEEQSAFYENLGRCIAQWSHVEDGLYSAFATAIAEPCRPRANNLPAQAGFYAIVAAEGKVNLADAAVRFKLLRALQFAPSKQTQELLDLWDYIKKRVDKRRSRRNQLAHFQTLVELSELPGQRYGLRPALFNPNAAIKPIRALHHTQLKEIARSFGQLSWDLSTFVYGLSRHFDQIDVTPHMDDCMTALLTKYNNRQVDSCIVDSSEQA